jgi:hypothetical protein
VILQGLADPKIVLDSERDSLYENMFASAEQIPKKQGHDFMYQAAIKMKDLKKRERLLGRLLITLYSDTTESSDKDDYRFTHSDIDLALQYFA